MITAKLQIKSRGNNDLYCPRNYYSCTLYLAPTFALLYYAAAAALLTLSYVIANRPNFLEDDIWGLISGITSGESQMKV